MLENIENRKAAKKVFFYGSDIKEGEGKGRTIKEKNNFKKKFFCDKSSDGRKLEGG